MMPTQNVHLPTEATEQIPLTPTVDMKNTATVNVRTMDDNDERRETKVDHRTGWNKELKNGTYRGMLYGIVLRDYPKQVVSLAKAKSVPTNMREFLSWAQRHYRIDVTTSTVERKMGGLASAGACPGGCKKISHSPRSAPPPLPSPLHHKGISLRLRHFIFINFSTLQHFLSTRSTSNTFLWPLYEHNFCVFKGFVL